MTRRYSSRTPRYQIPHCGGKIQQPGASPPIAHKPFDEPTSRRCDSKYVAFLSEIQPFWRNIFETRGRPGALAPPERQISPVVRSGNWDRSPRGRWKTKSNSEVHCGAACKEPTHPPRTRMCGAPGVVIVVELSSAPDGREVVLEREQERSDVVLMDLPQS
jgi:hypothetical protein